MCGRRVLRKDSVEFVELIGLSCNQWGCGECAPAKRARVQVQALAGKAEKLLTLTVNPAKGTGPVDRRRMLGWAWAALLKRMQRRIGAIKIEYFVAIEATQQGEPHMHVLLRMPYVGQRWISEQMRDLIGAPIVDIRDVRGSGHAARYVAKYLGKDPAQFGTSKRYWMSRGWLLNKGDQTEGVKKWTDEGFRVEEGRFSEIVQSLICQGWRMDCPLPLITKLWKPGHWPGCIPQAP